MQFELNAEGVRELLKSDEIAGAVDEVAASVLARAGDGYGLNPHTSDQRYIVTVYAETEEAIRDNLENNTLVKCI